MEKSRRNIGPLLIILAGCFWGSMGIFVRRLGAWGFTSVQIVSIRITLAALFFRILLPIRDKSAFRIPPRDIPLFPGLGFGSILFFTVCTASWGPSRSGNTLPTPSRPIRSSSPPAAP